MSEHATVSFDDEPLILVDTEDRAVGFATKVDAHRGAGLLHRAFSIFLFAGDDLLLLQQRAAGKPLWPLFWSNSCCSHPRRGETLEQATRRRLDEELGILAELHFLFRFRYQARYREIGGEHEFCSVYAAKLPTPREPCVNPSEVAAWRWASLDEVDRMVATPAPDITPWFILEWTRLRDEFRARIAGLPATTI